ncbi:MAG: protein kinase [Myxococcales bacterium]|nr:protein kinase [Myxococcales bacterium]
MSPEPQAQGPSAEETRSSQGAAKGARVRPPGEPSASEALRSQELLAETLAHDPAHPVIDLSSDRVGRYVVLSKLGQGGMGAVYTAYDEELDRRVALKLVRESAGVDTLGHARMQREAQAMARLSHPNVVQVYDVGSHEGQIFIAMEYVRGSTLRTWQERRDPATAASRRAILDMYMQAGRGLAAAHRAGMVHRDFKPDNVLVGDDGRARVLDFGLAASISQAATASGPELDTASAATGLTLTGAVLGTPAFMAPELFLARPSDARTDQFSFCVALYRALYGAPPFAGETFTALASSVCSGELEAAPERTAVPPWLRAVLVRGLARDPADRYPDMDALLAALASDPGELRRRRLRTLARLALATLASALLIYLTSAAWTLWTERRRELSAAERLDRMEARVAELVDEGDPVGAAAIFDAFVRSPDNHGTAALPLAWLHRARRAEDAGEHEAALAASAASFAVATAPEHEIEALRSLLRSFRADYRWHRVIEATRVLEDRAPEAFADPELRDAQIVAATSRLDLAGAAAAIERLPESPRRRRLARLVAAMTPAHRTETAFGGWVAGDRGDATELAFYNATSDGGAQLVRVDAALDLPVLGIHGGRYNFWGAVATGPGEPARYSAHDPAAGEIVLFQAEGAELQELTRVKDDAAVATSADLDGDGIRELFLGTGPYSRHLVEVIPGADGSWSTRASAPSLDAQRSDITSLFAADLDGDGVGELVAGLGPWNAYQVHVLGRERASDELTSRARARLGDVFVAPLRGPRGIEIAALSISTSSAPGEALGLHLLRLEGEALVRSSYAALPGPSGRLYRVLFVGDLDGDGIDEAVAAQPLGEEELEFPRASLVFSLGEDGDFDVLPLAGVVPLAIRDLDGDGDDELVVSTRERVWVIGAGSERIPAPIAGIRVAPPPEGSDEWRDNWEHASELAQMGLQEHAADAFVALAESATATDEGVAARATLQAAEYRRLLHDDGAAAALFARAAADPALAKEASAAAIDALSSRGDVDALRVLLEELPTTSAGELVARARAELEAHLAHRVDLRFDRPLDPAWRIHAPIALARDALAEALEVESTIAGTIASLPIAAHEGDLILEFDVDVRRIEWGGQLSVSLASAASEGRALAINIIARGGQSGQDYEIECVTGSHVIRSVIPIDLSHPQPLGRTRLRAVVRPAPGILTCTVVDGDGVELVYRRENATAELARHFARGEVQIATLPIIAGAPLVSAALHRVSVIGARIDAARDAQPLRAARMALVEGDHVGALATLDAAPAASVPEAERALWRLYALIYLGRTGEARELLGAWLGDPERREAIAGGLGLLLRRRPSDMLALLGDLEEPAALRWRLVETLSVAFRARRYDPLVGAQLHRALEDYRPDPGEEPQRSSSLLELRASLNSILGRPAEARRDYAEARAYRERSLAADPARLRYDRAMLLLREATEAARSGDAAAARELVAEALRDPQQRAFVEDVVAGQAELAALHVDGE